MIVKEREKRFIEKAKKLHNNKYDYSKVVYVNTHTKVCIICPRHGEFWITPHEHLKGSGCKKCNTNNEKLTNDFIKKATDIHGASYDYSKTEYYGSIKKLCIICPEHGEFWQLPYVHLRGCGCPTCVGKGYDTNRFINESRKIHGNKYDYSKVIYTKNNEKVCIICPEHGEFWQQPRHHLNKCGCTKCLESFLEQTVRILLEKNNIKYIDKCGCNIFKWLGKQHLDFYLPEYNIAIECQGRQHFIPVDIFGGEEGLLKQKNRDVKKYELCKKNNIKLLYFTEEDSPYPYEIYRDKDILLKVIKGN